MISQISKQAVLDGCREVLQLPVNDDGSAVDDEVLFGLVRRSAGMHCPCSRVTLRRSLLESLQYLSDEEDLSDRIDSVIEGMIVGGDLLELHDVGVIDPEAKGTWVFAGAPSYVPRANGEVFLFGVVADQDSFLPESLTSRICVEGLARLIRPEANEDLPGRLNDLGLQRLSENTWLRSPKVEQPRSMLTRYRRNLSSQSPAGMVRDLEVLDAERPVTYYRGRWGSATGKTGMFVGRRPQEYGSAIWCCLELDAGRVDRFMDFPVKRSRWRGCDEAWHLQMALDHCRDQPQQYRVRSLDDGYRFDFFSPLPQWSERRLIMFGHRIPPDKCLMSYALSDSATIIEEQFLQKQLWLTRMEESG